MNSGKSPVLHFEYSTRLPRGRKCEHKWVKRYLMTLRRTQTVCERCGARRRAGGN